MEKSLRQCLALAGVAQAAYMVRQLAQHGMVGQDKLNTLVRSLFITRPGSTVDVFGSVGKLNLGMQVLQEILRNEDGGLNNRDVTRYFLGILHLERKLAEKPAMLDTIGSRLEDIGHPALDDPDLGAPAVIHELAALYQDTLSTLAFRIQVTGEMHFLKNEDVAEKVRAVLLAGIRAAVLWRQLGGHRWMLMFRRKKLQRQLLLLMNQVHTIH